MANELKPFGPVTSAWNTRPAAPVEGLETVEYQVYDVYGRWQSVRKFVYDLNTDQKRDCRELVTRSQAEAIIAAKDQVISDLRSEVESLSAIVKSGIDDVAGGSLDDLEADNAALTARIKELEVDVSAYILSAEDQDKQRKALETQLAAAEKALEFYADASKWDDGYFKPEDGGTVLRAYPSSIEKDHGDKARAVLGGKPS